MPEGIEIEYYRRLAERALDREIVAVDATSEGKDDTFTFEGARHASAIEVPVITAGTATGTE